MKMQTGLAALAALCALTLTVGVGAQTTEKTAITVNGEAITETEFYGRLQQLHARDFILSVNPLRLAPENAGVLTLNLLVSEKLTLQYAAKNKLLPADTDVNGDFEQLKKQSGLASALESKQVTEAGIKDEIRLRRTRYNIATEGVSVTPAEVEAYYKAHTADYTIPEMLGLAILRTSKQTDVAKIDADLRTGKPFADLVKTYSEDEETKTRGGELPLVTAGDPSVPAVIQNAVSKLKINQVSPAIQLNGPEAPDKTKTSVYLYVKLTRRDPAITRPFSDVKEQVERATTLEKAGGMAATARKLSEFRRTAKIEVNLPGYPSTL